MKKYGITKTFSIPLFLAAKVDEQAQSIAFAMYQRDQIGESGTAAPWEFGAADCLDPQGQGHLSLLDFTEFKISDIASTLAPKELSDRTNIYFCMESYGRFARPFNKMMESHAGKEPGGLYLRRSSQSCFAQLLVPHPDSKWDDMALRVTVNNDAGFWLDLPAAPIDVPNTTQAYEDFAADVFPSIEANMSELTIEADKVANLEFTVTPPRAGVSVRLKTDAGYLPRTEYISDERGKVKVRFSTRDLPAGEVCTVEAGFKWVSNLARTKVGVI